jgi:hypothetical protein
LEKPACRIPCYMQRLFLLWADVCCAGSQRRIGLRSVGSEFRASAVATLPKCSVPHGSQSACRWLGQFCPSVAKCLPSGLASRLRHPPAIFFFFSCQAQFLAYRQTRRLFQPGVSSPPAGPCRFRGSASRPATTRRDATFTAHSWLEGGAIAQLRASRSL